MIKHFHIFIFLLFNIGHPQYSMGAVANPKDSITHAKIKAEYYFTILQEFYKKGDKETHKLYSDSLLFISQKYKFQNMALKAMMNQGVYYGNSNKFEKALALYLKVVEKSKSRPEFQKIKIMTLINMANLYNNIHEPKKAIPTYKEALALLKKQPNNVFVRAAVYAGLAQANLATGNTSTSLTYNYRIKELGDSLQNSYLILTALSSISDLHNKNKNYKEALKTGKEALVINQTYSDSILKKDWILLNIGLAYKGLNSLNKATTYLENAKYVAMAKGNQEIAMYSYQNLAEIYEKTGQYKKSLSAQKKYNQLKENTLKEHKRAAVLDVAHDVADRNSIIKQQKQSISTTKQWLVTSTLVLFFGGVFILVFSKRKQKKNKTDRKKLQEKYTALENKYQTLRGNLNTPVEKNTTEISDSEKYKNSSLTEENRIDYMHQILDNFEKEKPYLDATLTQTNLAKKLGMSPAHLSEVLTSSFKQNFYSFINIYRISKAQELLKNPLFTNYKIESIGYDSGFNSKTSFYRIFKNLTGLTPAEYQKENSNY